MEEKQMKKFGLANGVSFGSRVRMNTGCLLLCGVLSVSSAYAGDCDFIKFNRCESCDDRFAFSVGSAEACTFLCPNREVNYEGSGSAVTQINCALKECPKEFPYKSPYGSCFATQREADSGYELNTVMGNFNEDDILDGISDDVSCPADKPLKRWDGACFSCNEEKAVRIETDCNIEQDCEDMCPNRTILYWIGGNVPSVPNCPPDKPLMDDEGICYACDVPIVVGLTWNERLCERFCPNEREGGAWCALKERKE